MTHLLLIAGFGTLGALCRYGVSNAVYMILGKDFPYGTLCVNVMGSLLIGFIVIMIEARHLPDPWRFAMFTGFLGAFTTFSAFSLETLILIESGHVERAVLNIILSVVLCLAACWIGMRIGKVL